MAVKTKDNLDEVRKEVYESMYIHLNEIMKDAASDIENHFESVVDMWYEAYDPKYYNRTYDTFYASSAFNSGFDPTHSVSSNRPLDKNYKVTKTDDGFEAEAGILVSYGFMHGYYDDPVSFVFPRTWEKGIHGTLKTGGRTTPPKSMMDKWFKSFSKNIYLYLREHGL